MHQTMVMSIAHRMTGAALYFGTLLLTWGWLVAAAEGPKSYQVFETCIASPPGKFVLHCYSWALIHHLLGGCGISPGILDEDFTCR
jgi:succinate dehydrogenase / fumarate reductase cytochrome b subunit